MKFGGSSVANKQQIAKVLEIVRAARDASAHVVVVSSAHKGITNALIETARAAQAGELTPRRVLDRQAEIAASLGCAPSLMTPFFAEIRDLLRGINLVKELSPRSLDYISSFGERMSVRCIADFFLRAGVRARAYDIWDLGFVTDERFGNARPLPGYEEAMRAAFEKEVPEGTIPVVTGFVGKTRAGEITTVGRNGSDLTATLVGAALRAREVQIWTDTDGVMTADPSVVEGARNIPTMHFDEAAELAYFGSRMLHPSTLLPAIANNIPVRVLNTNRPEHRGTVIQDRVDPSGNVVTSIAYKERQALLTIHSVRMFGQSGYLARLYDVLGEHGVVVDMIATSEVSISLTTNTREALERALPALRELGRCEVEEGKTILVVVGHGLYDAKGMGARILGAMSAASVNVEMVSYAARSINFSMLIDDSDIDRAVPVLHRELFS